MEFIIRNILHKLSARLWRSVFCYETKRATKQGFPEYRPGIRFLLAIFRPSSVFYINGSQALPAPLSKEEEAKLMQRLAQGDESVREDLIVHNLRLVVYIARKFENSGAGIEDLISIGTIGLIKAVNTFCPTRNIKLATYASRCIEMRY